MTPALNHAYRVMDAATYAALRDTAWLGEVFAPREERTTNRPDWRYTGVYLYGRRTYVEFFDEDARQGPIGASGLALTVGPGETPRVAERWGRALHAARTALVRRPMPTGDGVPWFSLACAEPDRRGHLHVWSMEYHTDFLREWYPTLTRSRSTDAGDVLDRYAARVTSRPRDSFLLDDVTGLELALSADALEFLDAHVTALDVRVTRHDTGFVAALAGTEVLARHAEGPAGGIVSMSLRLTRPVAAERHVLGRSTLELGGTRGLWTWSPV